MPCEKQLREQLVQPAEEKASGGFTNSFLIPYRVATKKMEPDSSLTVKKDNRHKLK